MTKRTVYGLYADKPALFRAAVHRFTLRQNGPSRMEPGWALLQRLCTRLSSRFNSNFRSGPPIPGQIRPS